MAKVLVIDDEANVRMVTNLLLTRMGHQVLLADNGQLGLQLFRQELPDVIVLDVKMPEMDGIEVLKQIRRVDLKQPVIVLTGDNSPETEREVRALGVSEFIVKGSSLASLGETLKRMIKAITPVIKTSAS
jgi:two-component system, NtrC family, response regulator AtoC